MIHVPNRKMGFGVLYSPLLNKSFVIGRPLSDLISDKVRKVSDFPKPAREVI
jgi:hypothetical protein